MLGVQVAEDPAGDLAQGTRVTLHLKPDAKEMASDKKLASLIKQYSEFIQFPIKLWESSLETEQARNLALAILAHQAGKFAVLGICPWYCVGRIVSTS